MLRPLLESILSPIAKSLTRIRATGSLDRDTAGDTANAGGATGGAVTVRREPRHGRRPTWRLGINADMWQPEGASKWFARCEYLAALQELARGTTAPRIREAFCALDRLADELPDVGRPQMLEHWAAEYGFLDTWLVELWADTLDLWRSYPDGRGVWEVAWPTFDYFDERAELGEPKRTLQRSRRRRP